jgi:TatD DNase family protein
MRSVPLGRMFLETDAESTDRSPTPIAEIYGRAAEILGVPVADLARQLYENYLRNFS